MGCYRPIPARRNGSGAIRLWPELHTENLQLPCGKCLGCKADRATEWARRAEHEAARYEHNTFITLTYDEENLPTAGHLEPTHLTNFLKRLRIHAHRHSSDINRNRSHPIKYLACGEYGDSTGRPHYHAFLFNCGFADSKRISDKLYESETLRVLWGHGIVHHGPAQPGSANYIAKYTLKKSYRHWSEQDGYADEYGEWHAKPQPFLRVSTRPAIGKDWLLQHHEDLQHGYLITPKGDKTKIPRYYRKTLDKLGIHSIKHAESLNEIIQTRKQQHATKNPTDNNTPERLAAREQIHAELKKTLDRRRTL